LDIEALQATLRTFAAERDWQPFHTPKNLSTALMVEAAELAEVFQWMTPEQSASAHTDAVVREQIADEVADVLLYLLQIADHTQVDLKRAVGRKLVKNAKKHPPVHTGLPVGTAAASTVETAPMRGGELLVVDDGCNKYLHQGGRVPCVAAPGCTTRTPVTTEMATASGRPCEDAVDHAESHRK
jgi:NTP pyrophosphatase (non-canonical NTP hydrolase)